MCSKRTATTPSPCRSIASPLPAWLNGGSGTNSAPIGTPAGLPIDASPNTNVTTSGRRRWPISTSTRRSEGSWPVLRLHGAGRRRRGGGIGRAVVGAGGAAAVAGEPVAARRRRPRSRRRRRAAHGEGGGDGVGAVRPQGRGRWRRAPGGAAHEGSMGISCRSADRADRGRDSCLPRSEQAVVRRDHGVARSPPASRPGAPRARSRSPAPIRARSGRVAPGGERKGESVSVRTRSSGVRAATSARRLLAAAEDEAGEAECAPSSSIASA